ncbi:MAG: phosphogluconate dehydrogenase C-terminal domain-containing protein [Bacteroidota bacterium]
MTKVCIVGAGGKMGMRLTRNLKDMPDYHMSYLESGDAGKERLKQLNIAVSEQNAVIPDSDMVILAVPDVILGKVSEEIIPGMKQGAVVITLDPACALAGKLLHREDLTYFIAHPSHPSIFNWEPSEEAQSDYFGGNLAKQTIVCAHFKGDEHLYGQCEKLAMDMYAPVHKSFRITAEQMGLLEPALVETLCSTLQVVVKEGLDEVVKRGVPEEAAREFLLGHMNIQLAVIYQQLKGAVFSDAANKAIVRGKPLLINPNWKKIFEPENVMEQIEDITK